MHPQMNVRIGVIEHLEDKDDLRHSKGTPQVLDVGAMGGNRIDPGAAVEAPETPRAFP